MVFLFIGGLIRDGNCAKYFTLSHLSLTTRWSRFCCYCHFMRRLRRSCRLGAGVPLQAAGLPHWHFLLPWSAAGHRPLRHQRTQFWEEDTAPASVSNGWHLHPLPQVQIVKSLGSFFIFESPGPGQCATQEILSECLLIKSMNTIWLLVLWRVETFFKEMANVFSLMRPL